MIVVLFRSKLVDAPDGYDAMAEEMERWRAPCQASST